MTMFTRFRTTVALLAILAASLVPVPRLERVVVAQATMTPTTLSSAITSSSATTMVVASTTGFTVGYLAVVDNEAMLITSVNTTSRVIGVRRGSAGTAAGLHAASAPVYVGPANYFSATDPVGPCTSTAEIALPRVTIARGTTPASVSVYNCSGASSTTQSWQLYRKEGYPANTLGVLGSPSGGAVTYTAAGAITPQPGLVFINGTTLAMTIVDPTTAQNGMIMVIEATNASAHTLTYTAGFNGGTTARDVATFGGAVGDNIVIIANGGTWWVISTRNVTLG